MACEEKEKVMAFLKGKLSEEELPEIERHIEACPICQGMVDGYMEKEQEILIPRQEYQGREDKLKEQASHYEKGTRRILIFTVVGMIMGWFSRIYVMQEFFPIKLILSIPYKASEILYRTISGANIAPGGEFYTYWNMTMPNMQSLFPLDILTGMLAEYITPALIGGAIYGSLAYFTGDKRVFTLARYVRYAAAWIGVIGIYVGGMFALNSYRAKEADSLTRVSEFWLETESSGKRISRTSDASVDYARILYDRLYLEAPVLEQLPEAYVTQEMREQEITLKIFTGFQGLYILPCRINTQECYLTTFHNTTYRVPEAFAEMVRAFYDKASYVTYDKEKDRTIQESRSDEEIWSDLLPKSEMTGKGGNGNETN